MVNVPQDLSGAESAINKLMETIAKNDAFSSPGLLSQLMVRITYFNHTIGRYLAGMQAAYRRKRKEVFDVFIAEGEKVTRAKEEADASAREEEETYDHYHTFFEATQTFINVCQSHLKVLVAEAKSQL